MNALLNIKKIYLLVFIISIISIFSAIYIEFVLKVNPCTLCIYQRIPYLVSIFICFLGYYNNKFFFWLYLLLLTFLISAILSGYHVGIENNVFKEFSGCTNDNINLINKEELLKSLNYSRPNCKNISFKILGLSLASINLIISSLISVLILSLIKYEKNK
tara:strand:+ start:372 stop:851 length:480 start_codon:yes stop_codon:yes gene_type:complete